MRIFLIVSLLVLNITHAQNYGTQDNYQQRDDQEYGGGGQVQDQGQGTKKKEGPGVKRKDLLEGMSIDDKTKLDDREKCNAKCDMTFIQCYRIQTDRSKCYSTQQECLGKCGGGVGEAGVDYESSPPRESGSELRFP